MHTRLLCPTNRGTGNYTERRSLFVGTDDVFRVLKSGRGEEQTVQKRGAQALHKNVTRDCIIAIKSREAFNYGGRGQAKEVSSTCWCLVQLCLLHLKFDCARRKISTDSVSRRPNIAIANRNFLVFRLFTWMVCLLYQSVPAILYFALTALFWKRADTHYHRFSSHCLLFCTLPACPIPPNLRACFLASRLSLPILPCSRKALSIRTDRFRFSVKVFSAVVESWASLLIPYRNLTFLPLQQRGLH
jgi:hypothetical protein